MSSHKALREWVETNIIYLILDFKIYAFAPSWQKKNKMKNIEILTQEAISL
jgi:hypothetical protein